MLIAKRPKLTEKVINDNQSIFTIEPLEPGFGYTLGNSLRRTLLSTIPGAAITFVRIDGVLHEFDTIEGVREDVTEIILNLKKVIVQSEHNEPQTCVIQKSKKGPITAADIKVHDGVTIANPDHYIATLNDKASLNMELTVERGRGFVPAELEKLDDLPAGVLQIDAIYSPVLRVTYDVQATRVEQRTDFDKLTIDVTTKSNIDPRTALASAGATLVEIFTLAKNLDLEAEGIELNGELIDIGTEDLQLSSPTIESSSSIEVLDLNKRTINALSRENISTIDDLLKYSHEELLKFGNFGAKSVDTLVALLKEKGFEIRKGGTPGEFDTLG